MRAQPFTEKMSLSMIYSSHDIAKIILCYIDDFGDSISNKKLQKLLYYIEAWALVYFDSILMEDFEGWVHGPVIPSVYREYKRFGYNPIVIDYDCGEEPLDRCKSLIESISLDSEHWQLIKEVVNKYGSLSAFELETLSHSEDPWKTTRGDLGPLSNSSKIISKELMKTYYSSLISEE